MFYNCWLFELFGQGIRFHVNLNFNKCEMSGVWSWYFCGLALTERTHRRVCTYRIKSSWTKGNWLLLRSFNKIEMMIEAFIAWPQNDWNNITYTYHYLSWSSCMFLPPFISFLYLLLSLSVFISYYYSMLVERTWRYVRDSKSMYKYILFK